MNWFNSTNAKEIGTIYLIFAVFAGMTIMLAIYLAICWDYVPLIIIPMLILYGKKKYSLHKSAVKKNTQRLHARVFKYNLKIKQHLLTIFSFLKKGALLPDFIIKSSTSTGNDRLGPKARIFGKCLAQQPSASLRLAGFKTWSYYLY